MTTSTRMDGDRSHMTDRILTLTLEIITLLTGERCAVVKMASIEGLLQGLYPPLSGEQHPITAPPPTCPTPEGNIQQKVLEVIHQVMELLTGGEIESPCCNLIGQEDAAVRMGVASSEEYKDIYRKTVMEGLYSRTTMEDLQRKSTTQELQQKTKMEDLEKKRAAKELQRRTSMEEIQKMTPMEDRHKNVKDQTPFISPGDPKKRSLIETCSRPPYFSAPEDQEFRMDRLAAVKAEAPVEEAEIRVMADPPTAAEMVVTIKEEELSSDASLDAVYDLTETSDGGPASSPHCKMENEVIEDLPSFSPNLLPETRPAGPSHPDESDAAGGGADLGGGTLHFCYECGQCFPSSVSYQQHQRLHSQAPNLQCSECGKTFKHRSNLLKHQRYHTGERPYPCPQCGKRFIDKSKLTSHLRFHLGMKQHSCSECGESFAYKSHLVVHQRFHTGEKTYSCPQCGSSYIFKSLLKKHLTTHTGEKPHVCLQCGKCFLWKSLLERHAKRHLAEKPPQSSGSEPFTERTRLSQHSWKTHSM